MDVNGNRQVQLTFDGTNSFPAWSPDGSKIAYLRNDENGDHPAIFIMDSNGQNSIKVYENSNLENLGLSWSPDGRKLAYVRVQDQGLRIGPQVGILDLESQTEEISALEVVFPRWVQWSPLGEYYVISAMPPVNSLQADGIFVVNRDGTDKRLILSNPDLNSSRGGLCWSPNERELLFGGENGDLFIVDVETGRRRIFMSSAHSPDWIDLLYSVFPKGKDLTTWGSIRRATMSK
jgi:TolB protein